MSSSPPSREDAGDPASTHQPDQPSDRSAWRRLLRVGVLGSLLVGAAFLYACDTVARISFPSRTLSETHTAGLTLPSNACGNPEAAGEVQLRFTLVDSNQAAIRPTDKGGAPLETGAVDMTAEDISFDNSGIFEYPDRACIRGSSSAQTMSDAMVDGGMNDSGMTDTGGGNGGGEVAPNSALARQQDSVSCQLNNYSCVVAPGVTDPSVGQEQAQRCFNAQSFQLENQEVELVSDVESDQLFGVMVENSHSTAGYNPNSMTQTFNAYEPWNDSDDNTAPREADFAGPPGGRTISAIATDDGELRKNTVTTIVSNWENVRDNAAADGGRQTLFGLWGITGSSSPTSYVNSATSESTQWTGDADTAGQAESAFNSADASQTGANIYQALNSVVVNQFDDSNCPDGGGCDKTLVLIVDGPSDVPLKDLRPQNDPNAGGITFETLRQNIVDAGVRLFIVHWDPSFNIDPKNPDRGSPSYLTVDNPDYYGPQAQCSDDSDCFHHQECRQVDGFADSQGNQVSTPQDPTATYCVPVRGSDGRIGPLGQYSRLACASEGAYLYRKATSAVEEAGGWLPYTMDGIWEVSVPVEALGDSDEGRSGVFTRGQPIQLQTEIEYSVNRRATPQDSLTQQGNDENDFDARDTRSVIMTGETDSSGQ